jgi:hypothetical protein
LKFDSPLYHTAGSQISPLHYGAGSQISPLHYAAGSQISLLHDAAGSQTSNSNNSTKLKQKILGVNWGQVVTSDGKNRR